MLITGASGTGKSTLLRHVCGQLRGLHGGVQVLEEVEVERDRAVVDCFGGSLEGALECLSRAGLGEARVWLRPPAELSEGQQFRYRLARMMESSARFLVADEFCATLDRETAKILAWQFGRFVRRSGRMAVVATSHEDLAEDLLAGGAGVLAGVMLAVGRATVAFNTKTPRHQGHQDGPQRTQRAQR